MSKHQLKLRAVEHDRPDLRAAAQALIKLYEHQQRQGAPAPPTDPAAPIDCGRLPEESGRPESGSSTSDRRAA